MNLTCALLFLELPAPCLMQISLKKNAVFVGMVIAQKG